MTKEKAIQFCVDLWGECLSEDDIATVYYWWYVFEIDTLHHKLESLLQPVSLCLLWDRVKIPCSDDIEEIDEFLDSMSYEREKRELLADLR